MSKEQPTASKVRDAKDAHLMLDAKGINPGGNRYIYDLLQEGGACTLKNTGHIAVYGTSSQAPNLHPQEVSEKITIPQKRLETDFVRV